MRDQSVLREGVEEGNRARLDAPTISVVLRSPLLIEAFKNLLTEGGFSVNSPVFNDDTVSLVAAIRASGSELIIVDASLCERSSQFMSITRGIPGCRVVIMTDRAGMSRIPYEAITATEGILSLDLTSEAIIESLHLIQLGGHVVSAELNDLYRMKIDQLGRSPVHNVGDSVRQSLSRRELEISRYLLAGCSNKLIARHLQITEATVKVHIKGLLRKIRVANRTQAAIWAMNNGILAQTGSEAGHSAPGA